MKKTREDQQKIRARSILAKADDKEKDLKKTVAHPIQAKPDDKEKDLKKTVAHLIQDKPIKKEEADWVFTTQRWVESYRKKEYDVNVEYVDLTKLKARSKSPLTKQAAPLPEPLEKVLTMADITAKPVIEGAAREKKVLRTITKTNLTFQDLGVNERKSLLTYAARELQKWLEAYSELPMLVVVTNANTLEIGDSKQVGLELVFTKNPDTRLPNYLSSLKFKRKLMGKQDLSVRWKNMTGTNPVTLVEQGRKYLNEAVGYFLNDDVINERIKSMRMCA